MKDIIIGDGFDTALRVFDAVLDDISRTQASNRSCATGWAKAAEPLEEGKHYTISRVYPATSTRTCECGDTCTCVGKSRPKVRFDDILDDVQHVIFNDPATIVTFSDGSKVCVKACKNDTFNKETGLIYAIIKRLYADDVEKKTGYLRATGLGEKINKLLKNATDQKEVERERRRKQKQAKKEKVESEKENVESEKDNLANNESTNK